MEEWRKRSRPGHTEPKATKGGNLQILDQAVVHGGHTEEHGAAVVHDVAEDTALVKPLVQDR